jgi:hypothetical protein
MAGNQGAWPVYLTIGNIPKYIQKKPSANAVLLLVLLLKFPKGNNAASIEAGFHKALTTFFEPLEDVLAKGLDLNYADSFVRYCFPRLAAWMADTPEQSLLTSIVGGFSPVCIVSKDCLGEQGNEWLLRVPNNRSKGKNSSVNEAEEQDSPSEESVKQEHAQVTLMECLWAELDPYEVVAPDTLHQL